MRSRRKRGPINTSLASSPCAASVTPGVLGLLRSGRVEALSLDFDLGFRGEEERRTGEVVLQWIEERVFCDELDFELPEIAIHSSNPVGRQRLRRALDAIHRRLREPPAGRAT